MLRNAGPAGIGNLSGANGARTKIGYPGDRSPESIRERVFSFQPITLARQGGGESDHQSVSALSHGNDS